MIKTSLSFFSSVSEEAIASSICNIFARVHHAKNPGMYSVQFTLDGVPTVWEFLHVDGEWCRVIPIMESPVLMFPHDQIDRADDEDW